MSDTKRKEETREPTDLRLLEFLVCPLTKHALSYDRDRKELISKAARLAYPIRNGVPILTTEAARSLDSDADDAEQGSG